MSSRKIPADAFDYYVGLNEERSFEKVAQHVGVSKRAITDCARRENWTERLAALGVEARCSTERETREHCIYTAHAPGDGPRFEVHAVYSDDTDSIYFYIERYLVAPAGKPRTDALLRRLMELNWKLLSAKFEWNASTGEVRVGAVMNTDSNFDRRTLRRVF